MRVLLVFMRGSLLRVSNPALWDSCVPSYKQANEQIVKHKQRNQTRKKNKKIRRERETESEKGVKKAREKPGETLRKQTSPLL